MKESKSASSLMKSVQKLKKPQYRGFMGAVKMYLDLEEGGKIKLPLMWGKDFAAFRQKVYRTRDLFKECSEHPYFEKYPDILDMAKELDKVNARTFVDCLELEKKIPFDPQELKAEGLGIFDKIFDKIEVGQEEERKEKEELEKAFLADVIEDIEDSELPPSAGDDWLEGDDDEGDEVAGDPDILKWL